MKTLIIAAAALFYAATLAAPVWACYTQTYIINGEMIVCTVCGNVTSCY